MKLAALIFFASLQVWAYSPAVNPATDSHALPEELQDVGVTERLGQQLTLTNEFTDHNGEKVQLAKYFNGNRPVLMTMVYYECPSLCNYHLNGLLDVMKKLDLRAGRDFDVVAVSMDQKETADLAGKKRLAYLKELNQPGAEEGWHFLVGDEANVMQLADELGFKFKWNEGNQQFSHAAVAYVVTPGGMISRYLYGIEFPPKTLRLSLVEASNGKVGNIIDQIVLFCFQFNPAKNKYTLYAFNLMQLGAVLTLILMGAFLIPYWIRERRRTLLAKGE